ncbi:hypothetical protein Avbf_08053 [Armadillidium vulgare]|nr:hypothetical protein Avbf_08053 [Armadillidium vulgare]
MRRMSGDPVLILPRRLSAQELRYEEGYGQEHVRGILKSDPGREKHKENPKSILKVDSRKSSFSEGEHPKGILKSESPMSSNKGSPEHDARSLKSVLKKDSSSEESKEIKSILKPESQSFDPEISSDSSSDVTTQDLSFFIFCWGYHCASGEPFPRRLVFILRTTSRIACPG